MERIVDYVTSIFKNFPVRIGPMGMLPLFIPLFLSYVTPSANEPAALNKIEANSAALAAIQASYFKESIEDLYADMDLAAQGLSYEVFQKALIGYMNLKGRHELSEKPLITILDFEKPSSEKRLWVLDLKARQVLFHTYAAHGRNSGDLFARSFSNINESFMSSLGFYVTGDTYFGKHGLSLKLEGKDQDFNSKAFDRNIVIHGADYVSDEFIRQYGRLGRSLGCPALPVDQTPAIVEQIKDKTCLYLHAPEKQYASDYLNPAFAMTKFFSEGQNI